MNLESTMNNTSIATYIHIPFCKHICTYCDFCKLYYKEDWVDQYLKALEQEINEYQGKPSKTIYIGGGTPSCLSIKQLQDLFRILQKLKRSDQAEITIECNPEISVETLQFLYQAGVNRLSFGVESFQEETLKYLGRTHRKETVYQTIEQAKQVGFQNISLDLMYGIPGQTQKQVKKDLMDAIQLNPTHISAYSLIIEENTMLKIWGEENIEEDLDEQMYQLITTELATAGYRQYEVSNFAIPGYESKHNLTYWNNETYNGFGLGAHGYIANIRYEHTRGLNHYLKDPLEKRTTELTEEDQQFEEMMLGLRKTSGVSRKQFQEKFQKNIEDCFDLSDPRLEKNKTHVWIKPEYFYVMNDILIKFLKD